MRECVVVLGMHRSGTSVLTGLVSFFGGFVGSDLMSPTEDNPKGYFENNKIYLLNERILKECGASWDDYSFVAESIDKASYEKYIIDAKTVIEDELKYVNKLIIKDPRLCILFPIWERALSELNIEIKLVLAYRSPVEVSHSLLKRDDIAIEKGLMIWSHYFFQSELYSRKYPRMLVEYDADFKDMPKFVENLGVFLGQKPTDEILQKSIDFYSYKLKHHQVSFENIADDLPSYLNSLNELLANKKLDDSQTLDLILKDFTRSKKYFRFDDRQRVQEKQDLKEVELKFEKLEVAYHKLKDRQMQEHELLITSQEELNLQQKLTAKTTSDLHKQTREAIKTNELARQSVKDKQHQVDLIKSYYVSANHLFQRVFKQPSTYKKLHNQSLNSSSLKLKQSLNPFSKNKRLTRDKVLIIDSGLFSPFFYLTVYPDIQHAGVDPLKHFCTKGWREGRNPSMDFDVKAYLGRYPDVARAKINPVLHYIQSGKEEGRIIDSVLYYGETFVGSKRKTTNKSVGLLTKSENIVGPIIDQGWGESIQVISSLKSLGKIANKSIPSKIIDEAKKQMELYPLSISVVMPTWNRANTICKAIDSVLQQSYQANEIIISDDGSTDETVNLLNSNYSDQISSGLIIILKNNHQGVSATRNAGLAKASGDLIAYLDSDNIWREDYLLLMAAAFSENDELNCAYSALEKHDANHNNKKKILAVEYDRKRLLDSNFIDLNVFVHRKQLYDQLGGFDTQLKRLVDWDLIISYTKNYMPVLIPFVGVDYFLDDVNLKNITTTVSLDDNRERVYQKHFQERIRYGLLDLQLAYVLWDFPALSQTFVMEELKWLVQQGYDVIVYYATEPDKAAILDFEIDSYQVETSDELVVLFEKHQRNLCHAHFAYPTVTKLVYPACIKANIPFTFMPHAVDIFHHENKNRNNIGEITQHPLCLKVFVHGEFHKKFIEDCGVPSKKIAFNIQAVNVADFTSNLQPSPRRVGEKKVLRGVVITRFVEKKGLSTLIEAASILKDQAVEFDVYGYGPLEEDYKKQIDELGLANIHLKGPLSNQKSVAEAYQKSDFLIAPCVVAKNGDVDGFPTVILEAMAMGLPVITTDVAAIPDYLTDGVDALISPAADEEKLAQNVRKLIAMSPQRKAAMIKRSQDFLEKKIGVKQTMQMLLDTWQGYTLDIFLVTYNTEKYEDRIETFEIIDRIFRFTTTPFTLTIIDNDSDEDFWSELCDRLVEYTNVRLIRKKQNQFCGPASNIALEMSDSEYAIYICSKEGFIKKHGWERTLLEHMRKNPNDAIAGHHSQMPKYIYGSEYQQHPDFSKFRNPEFAKENPERKFAHVQGGIYILSREFIKEYGGFNPATPHGGMDIEMSYYIESMGYGLGKIPEVASLTVKTLPKLSAIIDEKTVIAHPLTIESVAADLDSVVKSEGQRCNICNWKGKSFTVETIKDEQIHICPECSSTDFGRSVMKLLANNPHIYRGEKCVAFTRDPSLENVLGKLFKTGFVIEKDKDFLKALKDSKQNIDCIIIDPELINNSTMPDIWQTMIESLSITGEVIFADKFFLDDVIVPDATKSQDENFKKIFSEFNNRYSIEYTDFSSYCIAYDWRRFGRLNRARA